MKFLAIETELKSINNNDKSKFLKEEADVVLELKNNGVIQEIYFNEEHCAVIILNCDSIEEAEIHLNKLPLVINGFIKFNIMHLNPYTGFDRLV